MNAFGIIAEYNPFHYGHEYLINRIKADYPDAVIAVVMSGDFVQRGEAAVFSKYTRAQAACRAGADLIVELPVRWSIAGAEGFATGAVGILEGIGIRKICFGSECGDIEPLKQAAGMLVNEDINPEIKDAMQKDKTLSFAAARSRVLSEKLGIEPDFFRQPNNILGIEYIKAAYKTGEDFDFYTFERKGNAHDKKGESDILSASDIRSRFFEGDSIGKYVPLSAAEEYMKAQTEGNVLSLDKYNNSLLTLLSVSSAEEIARGAYCGDEIANSLYSALRCSKNCGELIDNSCSKTYTKAHIRRAMLSGLLKIEKNECLSHNFARILAANSKGREYIKAVKETARITFITKPADIKKLSKESISIFEENVRAHDLYNLVCQKSEFIYHEDWKKGPQLL